MGLFGTLVLGLIAGISILLGLPIGRLRNPAVGLRVFLTATAVGVLLFLVWDILSQAWEPIDAALTDMHAKGSGFGAVAGYGTLFAAGLAVGLLSLVWYESWMRTHRRGSGDGTSRWTGVRRLALLIAVGIGLHNFGEGLAIGQSAARGDLTLATLLVIGFALHNATEGFGITAPLAGDVDAAGARRRPSWSLLMTLGLIGGGPTVLGAGLGHSFTSAPVSVVVLTLAAGSILYVVLQLVAVATKAQRATLVGYGLLVGLIAGFATDAIVTAAGA